MPPDESSGSKCVEPGAAATAMSVSMSGHLVWPHPFYKFGKVEDWAECICKRLQGVDYVPNDVLVGTAGGGPFHNIVWGNYPVSAGQWDDVLAQLS